MPSRQLLSALNLDLDLFCKGREHGCCKFILGTLSRLQSEEFLWTLLQSLPGCYWCARSARCHLQSSEGHCHRLVACTDAHEFQPKGSCEQTHLCSQVHSKTNTVFVGINSTCTSLLSIFCFLAFLLLASSCQIPLELIGDFNLLFLT